MLLSAALGRRLRPELLVFRLGILKIFVIICRSRFSAKLINAISFSCAVLCLETLAHGGNAVISPWLVRLWACAIEMTLFFHN